MADMKFKIIVCGLVWAAGLAWAAEPNQWWDKDPVFLSKDAIPAKAALPPPPANQSQEDNADQTKLLELQKTRTSADCSRAQSEVAVSLETFFGPNYGPLSAEEVKAWSPFFDEVKIDANYFAHQVKHLWKRPRPYVAHPELHPCVNPEPTDSYPSGHATISRVFARVLSLIDPKRKGAFETRADQIALDRVIGGVHNPSDVRAGQKMGDEIFAAMEKSVRFQNELKGIHPPRP